MISRRLFATSVAAGALLASLDPLRALARLSQPSDFFSKGILDVADISRENFAEFVRESFLLRNQEGPDVRITLERVTDDWAEPFDKTTKIEQFSLIFRGPADAPLEQGLYTIENGRAGSFDLMLVPIGQEEGGPVYQAAFSRFL